MIIVRLLLGFLCSPENWGKIFPFQRGVGLCFFLEGSDDWERLAVLLSVITFFANLSTSHCAWISRSNNMQTNVKRKLVSWGCARRQGLLWWRSTRGACGDWCGERWFGSNRRQNRGKPSRSSWMPSSIMLEQGCYMEWATRKLFYVNYQGIKRVVYNFVLLLLDSSKTTRSVNVTSAAWPVYMTFQLDERKKLLCNLDITHWSKLKSWPRLDFC
jgi:hypothetical protein